MNFVKITSQFKLSTILLLFLVALSCSEEKDDGICLDDVYGTYQGLLESDLGSNQSEVLWIHESDLENEVSISGYIGDLNPDRLVKAFTGIVSTDCQTIEIPEQQLITSSAWVSGSFTLVNDQLSGTLIYRAREYNFNLNKLN